MEQKRMKNLFMGRFQLYILEPRDPDDKYVVVKHDIRNDVSSIWKIIGSDTAYDFFTSLCMETLEDILDEVRYGI